MPSYEFTCRTCHAPYEVRQSMSAYSSGEGQQCPSCGSADVERRFTTVTVMTGSRSSGGSSSCRSGSGFT